MVTRLLGGRASNIVRFAIVGLVGVAVNSVLLSVLYSGLHFALPLAAVVSYEIAVITNFLLDERWAFGYRSISWVRFGKFNLTALGGLVMTAAVLWLLVTRLGVQYLVANALALGTAGLLNLLLSIFWIWSGER
jgi:dolichol-phosphate mannosyltransferase